VLVGLQSLRSVVVLLLKFGEWDDHLPQELVPRKPVVVVYEEDQLDRSLKDVEYNGLVPLWVQVLLDDLGLPVGGANPHDTVGVTETVSIGYSKICGLLYRDNDPANLLLVLSGLLGGDFMLRANNKKKKKKKKKPHMNIYNCVGGGGGGGGGGNLGGRGGREIKQGEAVHSGGRPCRSDPPRWHLLPL